MNKPPLRSRQRGFTLTELLVTVAISASLALLAIPSFEAARHSIRLTNTANAFVSQLYAARSEAIKRKRRVGVCKSPDGIRCTNTGGWEQGWMIFDDRNNDGNRVPGEDVIHVAAGLPADYSFFGNQYVARYLSFSESGDTRLTSGAFQAGTLTICRKSKGATDARQIVINAIGRPRIQRASLAQCI